MSPNTFRSVTVPADDGAYPGVDEASYHSDPTSLSVSGAKLLLPPSCPAKFRWRMDNPQPPKRVFDFGHLAHRLILGEGAKFAVLDPAVHGLKKDGTIADSPRATAGWKAAETEARANGLIPVSVEDWQTAQAMADKVAAHPVAGPLFTEGQAELSLYHRDPETGIRLRGRLDLLRTDGEIVDYKTSTTSDPAQLERLFHKYGYHMQAAWYMDLAVALGLSDRGRFLFVAQEKEPPYLVTVAEYDDEALAEGRRLNREAINLYAELVKSGQWPGYSDDTATIGLPVWALEQEIDI